MFIYATNSAAVIFFQWESIAHRLSREVDFLLMGYALCSLVFVAASFARQKMSNFLLLAAAIPYISSTIAYAIDLIVWSKNLKSQVPASDLFNFLLIALFFPYFAMWGPLISALNLVLIWPAARRQRG